MPETLIRRAGSADAEALSAIGRETFTAAFGHLYPRKDLDAFLQSAHAPAAYAAWADRADTALWLVERDGRAVGYALAGPCGLPHPDVTARCGELKRIYLLPETQGGGLGGRLLQTALDWLEQPGRMIWLGVFSDNVGARRFYTRYGFEPVGDYYFEVGETQDFELILRRPPASR
jgi:GNAT superfamily N-acetyltransferase